MEHNRDLSRSRGSSKYIQPNHYSSHRSVRQPDHQRRNSRDDRHSSSKSIPSRESTYKIVEYSDVSSEDFSAPEAGEIEEFDAKLRNDSKRGVSITVTTGESLVKKKKHGTSVDRLNFAMSPGKVRRVIIGSPISSSVSSGNSRSKTPRSPVKGANRSDDLEVASLVDEGPVDEVEIEMLSEDDSDSDRRHRKSKKSKKAKKNKRKKKKRKRSLSSIESISDNESLLAVDDNAVGTPPHHPHHKPQREISPWDQTYTPVKPSPMSPNTGGPGTPPLRPNSIVSMYSEESSSQNRLIRQHATPSPVQQMPLPMGQRNVASPHTPPPLLHHHHHKKNVYTNSPIDVEHHHHQLQHQQQHYYHGSGQARSPPLPQNSSTSTNHRRHATRSPGTLCYYFYSQIQI